MFSIENSEKRVWQTKEGQEEGSATVPSLRDNTMPALPSQLISRHCLMPSLRWGGVGWTCVTRGPRAGDK